MIRFVEGGQCFGRLELISTINVQSLGPYGQACRRDAVGDTEAMVICRQLNCNPVGARRVDPVQ